MAAVPPVDRGAGFADSRLARIVSDWIFRPRGRERGRVVLTQRRIFILPTRQGVVFAGMLLLMLIGSTNYQLSLGFAVTFLLAAMTIVSILHTFRTLAGLGVSAGRTAPVFAGENAVFHVRVENPTGVARPGVALSHPGSATVFVDVAAGQSAEPGLSVPARRRGRLAPERITVHTRYPLGLMRAWSYVHLDVSCLVYPKPEGGHPPLPVSRDHAGDGREHGSGTDDFAGLREYRLGDSPRHIAWKAAAQERGTLTKQFSGRAADEIWLDWDLLADADPERRLSRLARWVLDAEAAGATYGLRIPGARLAPDRGPRHRAACLEALALFGAPAADAGGAPG
ncbi:MAG: DUF58 domain-containing protein [Pseudomonadota bacterium]